MKKLYFLACLTGIFFLNTSAQVSEKFHRVYRINTDTNSLSAFCNNGTTSNYDQKLNIIIENRLPVGTTFYLNLNGYNELWYVSYSGNTPTSDEDYTVNASQLNIINVCNNPNSYKLHRLQFVGNTLTQAQNNFCSIIPNAGSGVKVDIQRSTPLAVGKVYLINGTSLANGYYYVHFAGYYDGSDEDYNISGAGISSPVSFTDTDNDGKIDVCDNCPNTANSNQADFNNDGQGDVCDDTDGDGVLDANDQCPTEQGPSDNFGCPGLPNLKLKKLIVKNGIGQTYDVTAGQKPNIYNGEVTTFEITIENNGNIFANLSPIEVLFSPIPNNYPNPTASYPVFTLLSASAGQIERKSSRLLTLTYVFYSNSIPSTTLYNGVDYYFYLHVDPENQVIESNENNSDNISFFAMRFNKINKPALQKTNSITAYENNNYELRVYDFFGELIYSGMIISKNEENKIIDSLPNGFYIIKHNGITKKIIK